VSLDENLTGHLGDFGIAKLVIGDNKYIMSTSTPGTSGYIAAGKRSHCILLVTRNFYQKRIARITLIRSFIDYGILFFLFDIE